MDNQDTATRHLADDLSGLAIDAPQDAAPQDAAPQDAAPQYTAYQAAVPQVPAFQNTPLQFLAAPHPDVRHGQGPVPNRIWTHEAQHSLLVFAVMYGELDENRFPHNWNAIWIAMTDAGFGFSVNDIQLQWMYRAWPSLAQARSAAQRYLAQHLSPDATAGREFAGYDDDWIDDDDDSTDQGLARYGSEDQIDVDSEPDAIATPEGSDSGCDMDSQYDSSAELDEHGPNYILQPLTYDPYRDEEAYLRPFSARAPELTLSPTTEEFPSFLE